MKWVMAGKHRRDELWGTRAWVLVAGKEDPTTFWRMPTDLKIWTEEMRYGLGVLGGRIVPVSLDQP
jgi:hypothetical protein